jgi:organic hydroperoxide reductase OsmC/OhrA
VGEHHYSVEIAWTGNLGSGTATYRGYARDHVISAPGRPDIAGSSDPQFRGDPQRWNPEQLLVAALSQCHMLWYLHLCADAGVVVTEYHDTPQGTMADDRFVSVVLRPTVTVTEESMVAAAEQLHHPAHDKCYIANSVNFAVTHEPNVQVAP